MKAMRILPVTAIALFIFAAGISSPASAENTTMPGSMSFSVLGGIQAFNKNTTAFPDHIINVPVVGLLSYDLTDRFAIEGGFSWIIPVAQTITVAPGVDAKVKTPDILTYQGSLRANLSANESAWSPYVAAGAGAVTFLSNTASDRFPQLEKSQTSFALNFGAGVLRNLSGAWGLRADFRELVAFPSKSAAGLSENGKANKLWMERGAIGLDYRF